MSPLAAFLVHQLLQKELGTNILWLDFYLDPICLGALGLHSVLLERRLIFREPQLSLIDILMVVLLLAIASEVVFPYFSDDFVADWRDVAGISLGACWFVVTRTKIDR